MKNPWIPFYWGDYLAHTTHLSTFEHGCYILLLARYYVTGKPLTTLEDGLFRVCHANSLEERNSVMKVVTEFFVEKSGAYHHGRADEEIKKRASISKIRSDARSHRVNKSSTNEQLKTTQSQPQSQSQKEGAEPPPAGLHPLNYARHLCVQICMPIKGNLETVASAVEAVMGKQEVDGPTAMKFLLGMAREAERRGDKVDRWWFQDSKWKLLQPVAVQQVSASELTRKMLEQG